MFPKRLLEKQYTEAENSFIIISFLFFCVFLSYDAQE